MAISQDSVPSLCLPEAGNERQRVDHLMVTCSVHSFWGTWHWLLWKTGYQANWTFSLTQHGRSFILMFMLLSPQGQTTTPFSTWDQPCPCGSVGRRKQYLTYRYIIPMCYALHWLIHLKNLIHGACCYLLTPKLSSMLFLDMDSANKSIQTHWSF